MKSPSLAGPFWTTHHGSMAPSDEQQFSLSCVCLLDSIQSTTFEKTSADEATFISDELQLRSLGRCKAAPHTFAMLLQNGLCHLPQPRAPSVQLQTIWCFPISRQCADSAAVQDVVTSDHLEDLDTNEDAHRTDRALLLQ